MSTQIRSPSAAIFVGIMLLCFGPRAGLAQGWSYDADFSDGDPAGWTAVNFAAASIPGPYFEPQTYQGRTVLWCGRTDPALLGGSGYGDNWNMWVEKRFDQAATGGNPGRIAFDIQYDTESGYDWIYVMVSYDDRATWDYMDAYSGSSVGFEHHELNWNAFTAPPIWIRFAFVSDGFLSDASGQDFDGAFRLDNVRLVDIRDGSVRDEATFDAGLDGWIPGKPTPPGPEYVLQPASFWSNYGARPDGGGFAWTAIPAANGVFPPQTSGASYWYVGIESPTITVPAGADAYQLAFQVYRQLPIMEGLVYQWSVASPAPEDGGVWRNNNFVYYGNDMAWLTSQFDITPYVDPAATTMRLRLIARFAYYWYNPSGVFTGPGPIFGGVTVTTPSANTAPTADAGVDQTVACTGATGASVTLDGTGSFDPDGDPLDYSWSLPGGATASGATAIVELPPGVHTITLTVADGNGAADSDEVVISVVDETAPTVGVVAAPADPVALGANVSASAHFEDACDCGGFVGVWNWGDGNTCATDGSDGACALDQASHTVSGSHVYGAAGVYTVSLTVSDCAGNVSDVQTSAYVVVYDPSAGFVTGGGWIESPAGAYRDDPALVGPASFGFVSKYKKGQSTPDGQTQFSFRAGGLNFHSTAYQWLVIAGQNAKYKGYGDLNGLGGYGFLLTAVDGDAGGGGGVDRFWIRIWELDDEANPIYDNQRGADEDAAAATPLAGGSIVIHSGGSTGRSVDAKDAEPLPAPVFALEQNTPNPFNPQTTLRFQLPQSMPYELTIYSVAGRMVERFQGQGKAGANEVIWDAQKGLVASGTYIYRLRAGNFEQARRMMLIK